MPRRPSTDDDQPFSGRPLRNAHQADPQAAAPALKFSDLDKLTGRGHIAPLGNADARPPILRDSSNEAAQYPSRRGDRLHYPDGRVTDLAGNPIAAASVPRCSLPDGTHAAERIRRVVDARTHPGGKRT